MVRSIAVFSQIENKYISFQGVLSEEGTEPEWTIVFDDNKNGLANTLIKEHLGQMLLELTGFDATVEIDTESIQINPVLMLIIIGANDVIIQNRYPSGWFTAASVVNAYRLDGLKSAERIAPVISMVSDDFIESVLDYDSVESYLNELVQQGMLEYKEMEDLNIYKFIAEYDNIFQIFKSPLFKTACYQINDKNTCNLLCFFTKDSRTWCFKVKNNDSSIELMDKTSIFETIEELI